jgi:hypothetical protein
VKACGCTGREEDGKKGGWRILRSLLYRVELSRTRKDEIRRDTYAASHLVTSPCNLIATDKQMSYTDSSIVRFFVLACKLKFRMGACSVVLFQEIETKVW